MLLPPDDIQIVSMTMTRQFSMPVVARSFTEKPSLDAIQVVFLDSDQKSNRIFLLQQNVFPVDTYSRLSLH